jgi:hypothetical protein
MTTIVTTTPSDIPSDGSSDIPFDGPSNAARSVDLLFRHVIFELPELWQPIRSHMYPGKRTVSFNDYLDGDAACANGYLTLLQLRGSRLYLTQQAMTLAIAGGHTAVVHWLHQKGFHGNASRAFKAVAKNGDLPMLQWLQSHYPLLDPIPIIAAAAKGNHYEVLEWVSVDVAPVTPELENGAIERAILKAAEAGWIKVIQWLHQQFPNLACWYFSVDCAASGGQFEMFQWFEDQGLALDQSCVMDSAAAGGHLSMVEMFHRQGKSCSSDAMDLAAAQGHLEVVQWLHANRAEGCTTDAMDAAAKNGDIKMVEWLRTNRSEGCTRRAIDFATANGDLVMTQWLTQYYPEPCRQPANCLINNAASSGNLELVQWLNLHYSKSCNYNALDDPASRGDLEVVKWLLANRAEGCSTKAFTAAARHGHLHVLEWFYATFIEPEEPRYRFNDITITDSSPGDWIGRVMGHALGAAISGGETKATVWLWDRMKIRGCRPDYDDRHLRKCIAVGNLQLIRWLYHQGRTEKRCWPPSSSWLVRDLLFIDWLIRQETDADTDTDTA